MIYKLLINLIADENYEKEDMLNKLDVFFTFDRIAIEQYQELTDMINNAVALE